MGYLTLPEVTEYLQHPLIAKNLVEVLNQTFEVTPSGLRDLAQHTEF